MRSIWLSGLALLCLALSASATTYVVHPDGTGDYPTIQAAVTYASSGDIVELTNGVFHGQGNRDIDLFDRDLTIRSQSGNPELCIIHCGGSPEAPHRAFYIGYSNSSLIEGIAIEAEYSDETALGHGGGGVQCWHCSPTFTSCIFLHCSAAAEGGGIYCTNSTVHFNGCQFYENEPPHDGAGICAFNSNTPLDDCTLHTNQGWGGAGIYSFGSGYLSMDTCELYNNTASASGGALSTSGTEFIAIRVFVRRQRVQLRRRSFGPPRGRCGTDHDRGVHAGRKHLLRERRGHLHLGPIRAPRDLELHPLRQLLASGRRHSLSST